MPIQQTRTTIRDVAKSLNLSHTTVSRVLNGRGGAFISEATRERVLDAVREMNYRPNRAARTLATGRTNLVALWVPDVFHPYYVRIMQHAGSTLEGTGNDLVIYRLPRPFDPATAFGAADGILVLDYPEVADRYREFDPLHAPLVNIGVSPSPHADHVRIDLYPAAREAVLHLVARGCRRVAYLADASAQTPGESRFDAYREVLRESGIPPEFITAGSNAREDARRAVVEHIRSQGAPDGLFCLSDDLALGAYRALCDIAAPPSPVSGTVLVGCDGIEEVEYLERPFSTIALPIAEMCATAHEFLRRRKEDPGAPLQSAVLPARFVPRP